MNGNPVRASRLRLVSLCALFLLIRTTVVNAQTEVCASYEPTQTQIQGSKSWCWAACLQFLYTVYGGSGFSQSLIAHRIVAYYCSDPLGTLPPAYGPWDPDIQCGEGAWCNQWPYDVCNDHDYTVSQLRTFMEWGESFWTGGIRDPRSLSSAALKDELCGGAYLLAAVGHEYTGLGHLVVVTKIDNTGGEANASIRFWDPESDDWFEPSLGSFRNNGNGNGPWVRFFRVEAYFGNPNSVADIQSFGVGSSGHNVNLSFEIQGGADPDEYAAIYVSDNPAGPALLIDALTNHAALMPSVNQWTDNLRLAPSDGYYYWMDYDDGPFASARSPVGLLAATDNPAYVTGTARPQFDPPIIQALEDIPLDHGGSLRITWLAPLGSENADGFNVYRRSYPPGQSALGEWRVIGSTNLSTPTIVDNGAATGWVNDYRVSVAHHGGYALQPGDGNLGIWNDFSAEGSGAPIDNFANSEITLVSSDTLRVCPAGDDGVLHVDESIWGNVGGPTVGVPPEMLVCYLQADSVETCDGDTLMADGPTDSNGRTTLTRSWIAGHGRADLVFGLANSFAFFDTLTVYLRSPDENGDGVVSATDFAAWSSSYQSPPKTYVWHRDFNGNGTIGIGDYAYFFSHYQHQCESGSLTPEQPVVSNAVVETSFEEFVSASSGRLFHADVSVANAPRFEVMIVALRAENSALEFIRWERGTFPGEVLAVPVTRDGVKEISFGIRGTPSFESGTVDLGRFVFSVRTAGDILLSESDFEVRVADILTNDRVARMGSVSGGSRTEVAQKVETALAQNRPNPFNPSTSIAFSLAEPSNAELRIYDVRGAVVRQLLSERRPGGLHVVDWDGRNDNGLPVASGVYFYKLVAGPFTDTKKMTILK